MNEAWLNAPSLQIDAWIFKTLIFEEKMISFFFKIDEAWPNALSLEMDVWLLGNLDSLWKDDDDIFFKMDEAWLNVPSSKINVNFEKILLCRDLNKEKLE